MNLLIIKIGGNIIDDRTALEKFLSSFAALDGFKILVHGGGKVATDIGRKLDIEPNYINGRRVTDEQTLDLVTMVYGGLINKQIVALLQADGCNAVGLTGADGNLMPALKRPVGEVDYGFVGDVVSAQVNYDLLGTLLRSGLTPVLAPLTHDQAGYMLNTNADTIAQEVAKAMAAIWSVSLVYCFEKNGVLLDPDDESSVISHIDSSIFESLLEQRTISGGMIPKLENALSATNHGVSRVIIGSADQLEQLLAGNGGTCVAIN